MTLHLHVCPPAAVQLAKITTVWSWQQEWIPMCSFIGFQNHEVVCFYRPVSMCPLVRKLTFPGRRSNFLFAPPPPLEMAGIQTLKFLSAPFEKWNANGLFFVKYIWNNSFLNWGCRRLRRKNPNPWGAEEKWNVLGSWNKDVLPLSPIINWLIHWFVSFFHSFTRSFFHSLIYSFVRVLFIFLSRHF